MVRPWGHHSVCGSETVCVVLKLCCGKRQWAFCAGGSLGQPHVALSFNTLQFKYGVWRVDYFLSSSKRKAHLGKHMDSVSQTPYPTPWSFQERTLLCMEVAPCFRCCVFCIWCFLKLSAETCSSRNLIQFFEGPWMVELIFCSLSQKSVC